MPADHLPARSIVAMMERMIRRRTATLRFARAAAVAIVLALGAFAGAKASDSPAKGGLVTVHAKGPST
jgi:hypothetical protein